MMLTNATLFGRFIFQYRSFPQKVGFITIFLLGQLKLLWSFAAGAGATTVQ